MPCVRIVFRCRKAANLLHEHGDNSPYGLKGNDIVSSYCFDVMEGETVGDLAKRAISTVVHTNPHPLLCRVPHFVAVFADYSLTLTDDSTNGFRIFEDCSAADHDGSTLVVCYSFHAHDRAHSGDT